MKRPSSAPALRSGAAGPVGWLRHWTFPPETRVHVPFVTKRGFLPAHLAVPSQTDDGPSPEWGQSAPNQSILFNKKKALLGRSCAWTETVTQTCHGNFTMAAI